MAEAKIRLGFVGTEHLHIRGLMPGALNCPWVDVVGMVSGEDEHREYLRTLFPSVRAYATAEEFYDKEKPQAIFTVSDNRVGAAVVADAAARGIHVAKEKPMAATLKLAEQMIAVTNKLGVRLMINWSTNWRPPYHLAKKLVDEGRIGQVWQIHNRAGHGGPPEDYLHRDPVSRIGWGWLIDREANGGGAFVDFCCYGAVLSRWFMGQPSRVMAMGGRYFKNFFTVEDNAVLLMGYPKGHSILEGTWTQPAVPARAPMMIYGSDGSIAVFADGEVQLATRGADARNPKVETFSAPALPAHYASGAAYFTWCLLNDKPFEGIVNPEMSRDAQEVLEAGLISMKTGKEVGLPLSSFLA